MSQVEENLDFLELVFSEFQAYAERRGVADLCLDEGRCLQVAVRFSTEEAKDKSEHRIESIALARTAAIWSLEIMRASPLLAPYRPELPPEVREFRSRINAWFAFFFAGAWMGVDAVVDEVHPLLADLLIDALQFRSGCRHTLALFYATMTDLDIEGHR